MKPCLLAGTNAADRGSAIGTLALRDGLAVLRRALDGILHFLLRLALHAISFDRHGDSTSLFVTDSGTPRRNARGPILVRTTHDRELYCTIMSCAEQCSRFYIFFSNSKVII